jgi:hypothetical protein
MTPVFPAIQATHAYSITPSDTVDVKDDAANLDDATCVFLHNPGTGVTVRVLPAGSPAGTADANAVTIYIAQGATCPLAVRRVYATTPATSAGDFLGFYSKQR